MAYTEANLAIIARAEKQLYHYVSTADAFATIAAADYFADKAPSIGVGDVIFVKASDRSGFLTVTAVTKTVGSYSVTTVANSDRVAANVAANASTPATCVTTPAAVITADDCTDLTTAVALLNIAKDRINTIIAENAVLKASITALITENATFKTTINAEIAALKAAGLQASA